MLHTAMTDFDIVVRPVPGSHHRRLLALVVSNIDWYAERGVIKVKRHSQIHVLYPGVNMATSDAVSVGHQVAFSIEYVDSNGNPMLTPVTPDSAPTWSNLPNPSGIDTFTVAAGGLTALLQATAAGSDTVALNVVVAGVTYTASDLVTISAAPQVLGGVEIVSVVS
jgi:hypothetical protein